MNKNRWPKSMHCQTEAVFHVIRSIRVQKKDNAEGIRSFGTWRTYKYEAHRFASFMACKGRNSILNVRDVHDDMAYYLMALLDSYVKNKRSRQTYETTLSAMGKFEAAINNYISTHRPGQPKLDTSQVRKEFYAKSKKLLKKSSKNFDNRAYANPIQIIKALTNGTHQLQASLQYEGGMRAEGVGAPSNRRIQNPLTKEGLRGIITDPVTRLPLGVVASKEKAGKVTEHYVSPETYKRLEEHIARHGALKSDYFQYNAAINQAARETNQYARARGTHGLKHNFAEERYQECVAHGLKHEQSLQKTSLELAHFRLRETLSYTRGR